MNIFKKENTEITNLNYTLCQITLTFNYNEIYPILLTM